MLQPVQQDIPVFSGNDPTFNWTVSLNGAAVILTGLTVNVYIKIDSAHTDTDPTTVKYTNGAGVTLGNQGTAPGTFAIQMLHADLVGKNWYHIDVVDGSGHTQTYAFGQINQIAT